MTRVEIDPNVRLSGEFTYSGFEDVTGPLVVGHRVEVFVSESGVAGRGRIVAVDGAKRLVYLIVDWPSLVRQEPA